MLPITSRIEKHHLFIGNCDTIELASSFGTPLYILDEVTIRQKCTEFLTEFQKRYPNTTVIYACKAFINRSMASLLKTEGLGLDVCSAGEINIAASVQFPSDKLYFHGNNKTVDELALALKENIGCIVVDNLYELALLSDIATKTKKKQDIMLRICPGIDPHTHKYTTTGTIDSKFGLHISTGQAEEAIIRAISAPNINLVGLHCHLGSPIFETAPFKQAIELMLEFAAQMKSKHNLRLLKFSPGGGFAIQYKADSPSLPIADYAEVITSTLIKKSYELNLDPPKLIIEPGRSIIGQAGVALYTVGSIKEIPEVRKYILVDGGMTDNIRHALYNAKYEAIVANKAGQEATERVTISGRACESGDILVQDITLPRISPGDIIAIPSCGAYCISMSSNYNMFFRPTVIVVNNGKARITQRRETIQDIMRRDVLMDTN
ncbi:MAG: diaminopimelate decarboxylase [Dehalococcoidia bacterium]|nr:diaminopimelate decarboxylase [Dehalococcoidia bacterium]